VDGGKEGEVSGVGGWVGVIDGGGFGTGGSYCRAVDLGEFCWVAVCTYCILVAGLVLRNISHEGHFNPCMCRGNLTIAKIVGISLSRLESRISSFNLLAILFEKKKTPQRHCRLNTFNPSCLSDARLRSTYGRSHFSPLWTSCVIVCTPHRLRNKTEIRFFVSVSRHPSIHLIHHKEVLSKRSPTPVTMKTCCKKSSLVKHEKVLTKSSPVPVVIKKLL